MYFKNQILDKNDIKIEIRDMEIKWTTKKILKIK